MRLPKLPTAIIVTMGLAGRRSAPPGEPPVSGNRLINRQCGQGGGLGAQDPRAEPDAGNNGEFAESVKLRFGKAAFRTDKYRRRYRRRGRARETGERSSDRLAGAGLVAQDKA